MYDLVFNLFNFMKVFMYTHFICSIYFWVARCVEFYSLNYGMTAEVGNYMCTQT